MEGWILLCNWTVPTGFQEGLQLVQVNRCVLFAGQTIRVIQEHGPIKPFLLSVIEHLDSVDRIEKLS